MYTLEHFKPLKCNFPIKFNETFVDPFNLELWNVLILRHYKTTKMALILFQASLNPNYNSFLNEITNFYRVQ